MTSMTFFFNFIPILAIVLLGINLIFAPHNPYQEKRSTFECGFHSFLGQNRTQFSISFFIFALLFLLFDLEILLVYPYVVSSYTNDIYGLIIMIIFFLVLTLGFTFELGKNALKIDTRQVFNIIMKELNFVNIRSDFKNIIYSNCYNIMVYYTKIVGFSSKLKKIKIKIKMKMKMKMKSIMSLSHLQLLGVIFGIMYIIIHLITVLLFKFGILDCSVYLEQLGPLYMDGGNNNNNDNPLNYYPEYQQVNSLQEISNIKQHLLNIKQDLHDKLTFRTPQIYIDQLRGLSDYASRPNPHCSARQAADLARHFDEARSGLQWALQERDINSRNLAECNHRIAAVAIKITQLGGNPNA